MLRWSCGFPKSGLDAYVGKLVRAGHSIAIALQDEQKERQVKEVIWKSQPSCIAREEELIW